MAPPVGRVARRRRARYAEIQVARAELRAVTCASRGLPMAGSRHSACWCCLSFTGLLLSAALWSGRSAAGSSQEPKPEKNQTSAAALPRGKKLVLKDGTDQIVREYQRDGERVRYYSLERGDWEELPASMVDWEATAKAAGEAEKSSSAIVEKVHKQEEAARMDNVVDIDASLPVGDGAFLPSGEGMFVVEGKSVRILDQVGSGAKDGQEAHHRADTVAGANRAREKVHDYCRSARRAALEVDAAGVLFARGAAGRRPCVRSRKERPRGGIGTRCGVTTRKGSA